GSLLEDAPIHARLGARNERGPDRIFKKRHGSGPPNNRIRIALGAQRLQAGEQQGFAYMMPAPFRNNADRSQEIRTDYPMATKPEQPAFVRSNRARDWLVTKGDFTFARPPVRDLFGHPARDDCFFRRQRSTNRNAALGELFQKRRARG